MKRERTQTAPSATSGNQTLHRKLRIGSPDSPLERQADAVADQVMRMPEPTVQRKCARCQEDEKTLHRKEIGAQNSPSVAPPIVHNVLAGSGRPLDPTARSFMEPRFGRDFGDVRIHTGGRAADSADAVNALAYTVGRDVVFAEGQYRPETEAGRRLIAHELGHVLQGKDAVQRLTNPLSDMSTFQSPGSSGWRGATWGCYRNNCTKKHKGWDLHASSGTECKAVVEGTISHHSNPGGYGDYIKLTSSADTTKTYIYGHLGSREPAGQVQEGAKVAETGTGSSSGNVSANRPHLHFTVQENGNKVDPDGKGFTKPTKVIEATGSTATTYNASTPAPCTPCSM